MAEPSTLFKAGQILGITGSAFLCGFAFSASYLALPALDLAPPSIRAAQWLKVYDLGKLVSPTVGTASALIWGSVAYSSYKVDSSDTRWVHYGLAGLATFMVLPWTLLVMMPTNAELMGMAKEGKTLSEGRVAVALARWGWMNYIRAGIPMVGAVVGLRGVLN